MSRPGRPLFADLSITLSTGDRLGVVGLNGCGKSTLLSVMTGETAPESGIVRTGRGVRIAALAQRPVLPAGTVLAAVEGGAEHAWEAAAVLDHLGMAPLAHADTAALSGGQAKRVALARTLVADSDLLVLDEPTNHLDIDAVAWLEERLAAYRGGLVLVTHDRHVLDRVTTEVLELDRGRGYLHDGGYGEYLEGRAAREEKAATDESTRRVLARKELAWLRRGAPARTRKPKARIDAATAVVEGRAEPAARSGIPDLHLGTPRLGDKVVELHDVGFSHEGHAPLFEHVDLLLDPRERLGIVGPNGVGKSTLLDLVGDASPAHDRAGRPRADRPPRLLRPGRRRARPVAARPRRTGRRPPHTRLARRCAARVVLVRHRCAVGAGRPALGWGTTTPPTAPGARRAAQRLAPRRADERPRPRHAARARGVPRRLARGAGRGVSTTGPSSSER